MPTKIFPPNEHFRVTMYATSLIGLWPCIFEDNDFLNRIYKIYSIFIFTVAVCVTYCTDFKLFSLVTDEVLFLDEAVENLCISCLHTMILIRAHRLKSKSVTKIVRRILTIEEEIYKSEDEAIIRIYNSYASQSRLSNMFYIIIVYLATLFYIIHPVFLGDIVKYYPSKNLTVYERPLPLKTWFPFEKQNHYVLSYVLEVCGGCVVATFVIFVDIFNFSIIIFPLGQIQILKYTLQNFNTYASRLQSREDCSRDRASFLTLRGCILKHKDIISYVSEVNDAMRNVMVLDVLQSSVQLAASMLQLVMAEQKLENDLKAGQFIASMLTRLTIYYWYANEIAEQSSDIASSVYDNEWYNQSEEVKKMMCMVMLRCKKGIGLEIGTFRIMTLKTLLSILKGAYSYMTVVYK
uniref:Odorant receptor n=1 Tax=Chrysomela lapponica TaxID=153811 RepID=A0A310S6K7_CHRLA